MDDGDLLALQVLQDVVGCDLGLLVVAAAGAEDVSEAAIGQGRRGRGRRHHQDAALGEDVGGGHGDTRGHRADDEADLVADQQVGRRDALLGIAGIVGELQDDLLAPDAALLVDRVDGSLGAVLDLIAIGGDRTGQRREQADGDVGARRRPPQTSPWRTPLRSGTWALSVMCVSS